MKNLTIKFAVLLLSTLGLLAGAFGQITPSADSYTNTVDPTTNYGAKILLDVDAATQTTYIQFNLASIPATYTSADITKATLKLYVNTVLTAGSFNVDYVNGTWAESTITSSLAPALGTTIAASVPITTADKNQFILIDVTAAVQAWLSGTANDGIALVANGTFNATFDSKENTATSHAPELDVVFAGGGTLSGVTTASGSGLTGGGTSGTLNLGLLTTCASGQVLQWNGTAWACATAGGTGTVTSVGSGTGLTGGPITGSGTLSIAANACASGNALSALPFTCSPFATLGANTFTGVQTINSGINITSGSLSATLGAAGGNAIIGTETDTTAISIGVRGNSWSPTGYGVWGNNTSSTGPAPGVFGTTNSIGGYGVEGSGASVGVYGTGPGYGVLGSTTSSTGTAGVFTVNSGGTILQGINIGIPATEFKVDSAGNVSALGAVTAAGAVSGSSFLIGGQLFGFGSALNDNAFLGFAGSSNTNATVQLDTAVGTSALVQDTGGFNTAVGAEALASNTLGGFNTAVGFAAGDTKDLSNLTGAYDTALGYNTVFSTGTLSNATAIGANAIVSESNALVLGSGANVGIGTSAPGHLLDVAGVVAFDSTGLNNGTGIDLTFGASSGEGISSSRTAGPNQYGIDLWTDFNRRISIEQHGNVGIGTTSPDNLLSVNGSADKPGGGSWGTFSDARLKTVNGGFTSGLSQVMKIHPVHYRYKLDNAMGIRDMDEHIGVVAQEVQKVIPEAVTENSKGYLLVNNDPIIWTMLNAIKEQQGEVEQEQAAAKAQQQEAKVQQAELTTALRLIKQQQSLLRAQSAAMRSLKAEVHETRESLRKVKAQVVAAQPALVAAK